LSLEPIASKIIPGARSARLYLKSFSELYEKLSPKGLVPPQAVDLEESLLGAMMIDKSSANRAVEILGDRSIDDSPFYRDAHTLIYRSMIALDNRSEPIDLLTVKNQLSIDGKLEEIGGPSFLVELTTKVVTTVNVESYARIVIEKHIARELIRICEEIKLRAFEGELDTFDLLDEAESFLFQLSETRHRRSAQAIKPLAFDTMKMLDRIKEQHNGLTGVTTGLIDLDEITSGWQNSDLIVLAARPSQGKTALALNFARSAAMPSHSLPKVPVAIFSLEMGAMQLVLRMLCAEAKVDMQRARKGQMNDEEWRRMSMTIGRLSEAPIFIDDSPAITPLEIRAKARRLKARHNIGLVIVDYLQLMSSGKAMESREREISMISRSLKALAKELGIPVIALSQLNRSVESRKEGRPMLSDLRESGAIEQDSDIVLFIYRAETYGLENTMVKGESVSSTGIAEIIIGKQRNGPVGEVISRFDKQFGRFENYANWPEFDSADASGVGSNASLPAWNEPINLTNQPQSRAFESRRGATEGEPAF
jgi:replicative DNA helicase